MGFSFPFLRANDLRSSLLIIRAHSFFTLLYVGGTYARLVYSWHQNIFHVIGVLIVFHLGNKKTGRKKYQNKTANQERNIKMLLSLPIHLAHHRIATAAVTPLLLRCRSAIALLLLRY